MIEHASILDVEEIKRLMEFSNLTSTGVEEHIDNFLVARESGRIIGCAGIEVWQADGPMRSVAVIPERRGSGLGKELTLAALEYAKSLKLQTLSLLTQTAAEFFPKLGFIEIERNSLPKQIREFIDQTGVCPKSATAMKINLN